MTAQTFEAKNTITANSSVWHLLWVAEKLFPMQTNLERWKREDQIIPVHGLFHNCSEPNDSL